MAWPSGSCIDLQPAARKARDNANAAARRTAANGGCRRLVDDLIPDLDRVGLLPAVHAVRDREVLRVGRRDDADARHDDVRAVVELAVDHHLDRRRELALGDDLLGGLGRELDDHERLLGVDLGDLALGSGRELDGLAEPGPAAGAAHVGELERQAADLLALLLDERVGLLQVLVLLGQLLLEGGDAVLQLALLALEAGDLEVLLGDDAVELVDLLVNWTKCRRARW